MLSINPEKYGSMKDSSTAQEFYALFKSGKFEEAIKFAKENGLAFEDEVPRQHLVETTSMLDTQRTYMLNIGMTIGDLSLDELRLLYQSDQYRNRQKEDELNKKITALETDVRRLLKELHVKRVECWIKHDEYDDDYYDE